MQLSPSVTSANGVSGSAQWVQVINYINDSVTLSNDSHQSCSLPGATPALDTSYPYTTAALFTDSPHEAYDYDQINGLKGRFNHFAVCVHVTISLAQVVQDKHDAVLWQVPSCKDDDWLGPKMHFSRESHHATSFPSCSDETAATRAGDQLRVSQNRPVTEPATLKRACVLCNVILRRLFTRGQRIQDRPELDAPVIRYLLEALDLQSKRRSIEFFAVQEFRYVREICIDRRGIDLKTTSVHLL